MTEFTKEFITNWKHAIKVVVSVRGDMREIEKFALEALDEIERLQEQLEVERPTGICEICTSAAIKENARLRGEKERLSLTMKLIKDRGLKHGVEWCVAAASGALESEGE